MWGCWYELVYVGTALTVGVSFCVLTAFNVLRWKLDVIIKTIALAGLSVIQISTAFLVSELAIDYFDNSYSCHARESISLTVMAIIVVIILSVSFSVRSQKYVINRFADVLLGLMFVSILVAYVTFEVIL